MNKTLVARYIKSTREDLSTTRSVSSKEPQISRYIYISVQDLHLSISIPTQRGNLYLSVSKLDIKIVSTKKPLIYMKSTFVNRKKVVIIKNQYISVRDDNWTPRLSSIRK